MKTVTFTNLVAESYRIEEKTVAVYVRFLREAGLLTSGGRGRYTPHMQPIDAARITIALLATDKPARAVERLERFMKLTYQPAKSKGPFPPVFGIEAGATLERVLANLFFSDLETDNPFDRSPYLEAHENHRRATIEFLSKKGKCSAVFKDTHPTEAQMEQDRGELQGIRQLRGLASAELLRLYVPFYCERRDGKPWGETDDLENGLKAFERYRGSDPNGLPLDPNHPWNRDLPPLERAKRLVEIEEYIDALEAKEGGKMKRNC